MKEGLTHKTELSCHAIRESLSSLCVGSHWGGHGQVFKRSVLRLVHWYCISSVFSYFNERFEHLTIQYNVSRGMIFVDLQSSITSKKFLKEISCLEYITAAQEISHGETTVGSCSHSCISFISSDLFRVELHASPKDTVYCRSELLIIY